MRSIDLAIVHCTDSPDGRNFGVADVNEWHKARNFTLSPVTGLYVGYHDLILVSGELINCRPYSEIGCHSKGQNKNSIGVCWVGQNKINEAQKATLISSLLYYCTSFDLNPKQLFGHYEFHPEKTCPNLNMNQIRETIEMELNKGE